MEQLDPTVDDRGRTGAGAPVGFREAHPSDAEAVARLFEVLGYPAEVPQVRDRLAWFRDASHDHIVVAEDGDRIVGLVGLTITRRVAASGWFSRITALAVDPDARRGGIGDALVSEAERIAAATGSTLMQVNCGRRPERDAAHRFYPALGYRDQHDHHILYSKPLDDEAGH